MPDLQVEDLVVNFGERRWRRSAESAANAVDHVSLSLNPQSVLALVGESGSGKTTVARCIVGLQRATSGAIRYGDQQLGPISRRSAEQKRLMQMVFQDPRTSLNPRMTVRQIIGEMWRTHPSLVPRQDREKSFRALLDDVGLDSTVADRHAGDLSGGQCQRVSIARAISMRPDVLVCDEAVSALDVSVQAQVLRLLLDLKDEYQLAILFISHDLGVVRQVADEVAVMRRGVIVESGPAEDIYQNPHHEYTQSLLSAALDLATTTSTNGRDPL